MALCCLKNPALVFCIPHQHTSHTILQRTQFWTPTDLFFHNITPVHYHGMLKWCIQNFVKPCDISTVHLLSLNKIWVWHIVLQANPTTQYSFTLIFKSFAVMTVICGGNCNDAYISPSCGRHRARMHAIISTSFNLCPALCGEHCTHINYGTPAQFCNGMNFSVLGRQAEF